MTEEAVLDIVNLSTLEHKSAEDQVNEFASTWGVQPKAVALPVVGPEGVPFENDFVDALGVKCVNHTSPQYLGGIAYEFARLGMDVILTVTPTMQFVRSDTLHVIDITGTGSPQACIAKVATRRLLVSFIKEAAAKVTEACENAARESGRSVRLAGIALDLVDIWGMSAQNERIRLVCFCQECREQLASISKKGKRVVEAFERFPNPWNLVLRDSGGGIEPINEIRMNMPAKAIVNLSHLRGFHTVLEKAGLDLAQEAELLMEYMQTRHRQVLEITRELFKATGAGGDLKRILILEGESYGWTSGIFIEGLDDERVCDELWYDPTDKGFRTAKVPSKAYMWRRSRYFIDNFFEFMVQCQDEEKRTTTGLARVPDSRVRQLLELRRRQAMSARLGSKLDLYCLYPLSDSGAGGRVGFVGAGLTEQLSRQLCENVKIIKASPDLVEQEGPTPADLAELFARWRGARESND